MPGILARRFRAALGDRAIIVAVARAALGATPRNLMLLSLGSGVRQAMVGLVVGVGAALLLTRTMTSMLHGVTPNDPTTFVAVVVVTAVVAVGASLVPARRAARTDVAKVMAG